MLDTILQVTWARFNPSTEKVQIEASKQLCVFERNVAFHSQITQCYRTNLLCNGSLTQTIT